MFKWIRPGLLTVLMLASGFLLGMFGFSTQVYAGSVHSCRIEYRKNTTKFKMTRCLVEMSNGKIGEEVEIKNQYNYIVATGKIIKRKGRYTLVILKDIYKDVKSGYPVMLKNSDSIDHWTATTAPF